MRSKNFLKLAAIQMRAGTDKAANIATAARLVRRAARSGAKLIALPEVFPYRGPLDGNDRRRIAERIPGESLRPLMAVAAEFRAWVLCGSVYERLPGSPKVANTSVLVGPRGRVAARYRKIHLFDAQIGRRALKESRWLRPGRRAVSAAVGGFRLGLSVCYDLRFAELYRQHRRAGCDILAVPSAFTAQTGRAHWEVLLRARAIENLSYVVAPDQFGADVRGVRAYGNSMIVGPWGEILARASLDREQIIFAVADKREIEKARRVLPGISRRTSLVARHASNEAFPANDGSLRQRRTTYDERRMTNKKGRRK